MQINVEFVMPSGHQALARVILSEAFATRQPTWSLDSVSEDVPRRTRPLSHEPNHDSPRFRRQDTEGRHAYDAAFFRELLGDQLYEDILRRAWMRVMPEELKEPAGPDKPEGG